MNATRRNFTLVVIAISVVAIVASTLYWWQVETAATRLREETLRQAELRARQVNFAVAAEISTLFQIVDASAQQLAQFYLANNAAEFDAAVRRTEQRLLPGALLQVGVAGADGYLTYSSLGLQGRTSIADREHFKVHLTGDRDLAFISTPLLGRVSKQWTIQFSRPIRKNGALIGVIVLSIAPSYLQMALVAVTLDSDDVLAVFRENGDYLARNKDLEAVLGKAVGADRPFIGHTDSLSGSFTAPASFDGVRRLFNWQRLSDYPITVVFGLSEETALRPVEQSIAVDRRHALIGTMMLFGFVVAVAFLLFRMAQQQELVVRRAEQLRLAASVFDNSYEGIMITDAGNRIVDVNPGFSEITGYRKEDVVGKNPKVLSSGRQTPEFYRDMWKSIEARKLWRGEIWNRRKDGEVYAEILSVSAVCNDDGALEHYIGIFSDINRLKIHEQELVSFAHYDPLTGMPNRRLFFDRLKQALARAKRSGKPLAVGYIDLDSFKPINDRFGHMAGDQVLIEITGRVQNLLRAEDTIARIGGDEFVLLLADLNEIDGYTAILDRVLTAISSPIQIEGILVSISASIGVAVAPPAEYEAEILVKRADQAMYEAKLAGKNRYQVFAENIDRDS